LSFDFLMVGNAKIGPPDLRSVGEVASFQMQLAYPNMGRWGTMPWQSNPTNA